MMHGNSNIKICLDTLTDWTARSYVRLFDYTALQDDDTCRSAVFWCLVFPERFGLWNRSECENWRRNQKTN